jgi:hypothetical protein
MKVLFLLRIFGIRKIFSSLEEGQQKDGSPSTGGWLRIDEDFRVFNESGASGIPFVCAINHP